MHNSCISAKKKFSILSKLIRTQKVSSVPPINSNGGVVTNSQEKANIFNNFFADKATVPGNGDPVPPLQPRDDILTPLHSLILPPLS